MWHTDCLFTAVKYCPEPIPDLRALPLWRVDAGAARQKLLCRLMRAAHHMHHQLDTAPVFAEIESLCKTLDPNAQPVALLQQLGAQNMFPGVWARMAGQPLQVEPGMSPNPQDALHAHFCYVSETVGIAESMITDLENPSLSHKHIAHQMVLLHTCTIKMGDALAKHKKSIEDHFDTIKREIATEQTSGQPHRLQPQTCAWLVEFLRTVINASCWAPLPKEHAERLLIPRSA
eukprot:TRINITY_DN13444_c0_g1_i1.p1 TRINITY_DN13444_c0_g1~~TRINITY_DN13444_c0_g1_i1.p1  ORF type:complete len:232 (+),score=44.05 TRINITY_DN13444_c0_g1_i1:91-786(+)